MMTATLDTELRLTEDYQKVMGVMEQLQATGTLERGYGYCLSMSDMLYTLLKQQGIKSRLVECKLTVTSQNPPFLHIVGADEPRNQQYGLTDTHVVLITETRIPMIVDASIGGITNGQQPYIVERVNGADVETIAEHTIGNITWLYTIKLNHRLPRIHEQSIIERLEMDRTVSKKLRWLKVLVAVALTISALNAARGFYDYYQVYIATDNYWGPSHIKAITEKLDQLETTIKQQH